MDHRAGSAQLHVQRLLVLSAVPLCEKISALSWLRNVACAMEFQRDFANLEYVWDDIGSTMGDCTNTNPLMELVSDSVGRFPRHNGEGRLLLEYGSFGRYIIGIALRQTFMVLRF